MVHKRHPSHAKRRNNATERNRAGKVFETEEEGGDEAAVPLAPLREDALARLCAIADETRNEVLNSARQRSEAARKRAKRVSQRSASRAGSSRTFSRAAAARVGRICEGFRADVQGKGSEAELRAREADLLRRVGDVVAAAATQPS